MKNEHEWIRRTQVTENCKQCGVIRRNWKDSTLYRNPGRMRWGFRFIPCTGKPE